ncbi:MAG: carbon starvation CstA family protein [Planctomycetota bacterium]
MNVGLLIIVAIPLFLLGYRYHARYIARAIGENNARPTPAVELCDGRDYCPSRSWIVFAHHFASIAGAGPIIGPVLALVYGVGPVWLWLVIGGIFFGAVHDYTALFVSIREKGRSIAEVIRRIMGTEAYLVTVGFTLMMLILVMAAFLRLSAVALTSVVPLAEIGLPDTQTLLRTFTDKDGVTWGQIGGIASTSVIIITIFAPVLGFLHYKRNTSLLLVTVLAILACALGVLVGIFFPVRLKPEVWMLALSGYTLFASALPVWFLLQPRDFTNVFILYLGVALLVVGGLSCGFQGQTLQQPLLSLDAARQQNLPFLWPFLFITVACGAISGFHALVAGGTVSKQITSEIAARRVGYLGMLLESLLAVGVLCAIGVGLSNAQYLGLVYQAKPSNPVLAFGIGTGALLSKGLGIPVVAGTIFGILMVEGFMATTLDTAVRLCRLLWEELWKTLFGDAVRPLHHPWVNSGLSVGLMLLFAFTNATNAIWPLFGTGNQLLAAITLIAVASWLRASSRRTWFAVIPAVFMLVTTTWSLVVLGKSYLAKRQLLLGISAAIMLVLTAMLLVIALRQCLKPRQASGGDSDGQPQDAV